uniref:Circumsporozoite protein n=1 Tax=Chaetoceros debilis TaxID=122233 RepID=A0A7S3Q123_9STRA
MKYLPSIVLGLGFIKVVRSQDCASSSPLGYVDTATSIRFLIPYPPGTEGSIRKSCLWISRNKYSQPNLTRSRCSIRGVDTFPTISVADYCPQSCNCCVDSDEWFTIQVDTGGFITKQCDWVSRIKETQPGLLNSRCSMPEVSQYCPYTCDVCDAFLNAPVPTKSPSPSVSHQPSVSNQPSTSMYPSSVPSKVPSKLPSNMPSNEPSLTPSQSPSEMPSEHPSELPSEMPSEHPSELPSEMPSEHPSEIPSELPSEHPSDLPSEVPSEHPSELPSQLPSEEPSSLPSLMPSFMPSEMPSNLPSSIPSISSKPTLRFAPSSAPTTSPKPSVSLIPSLSPTNTATLENLNRFCFDTDPSIRFMVPDPPGTNNGKRKTCKWVQRLKNTQPNLIWKRCGIGGVNGIPNVSIADYCPKACDTCGSCQNSRERFVIPNPPGVEGSIRKSCNWITRVRNDNPNLWFKRCAIDIVAEKCAAGCELC